MGNLKYAVIEHLNEHFPTIISATSAINTTGIMKELLVAGMIALITSTLTADKVSARLEERIAALSARVEKCEDGIAKAVDTQADVRERMAQCERSLEIKVKK